MFNVLHHVPQWHKGIQEIARILKIGGYVLFEEPTKKYTNFTVEFLATSIQKKQNSLERNLLIN